MQSLKFVLTVLFGLLICLLSHSQDEILSSDSLAKLNITPLEQMKEELNKTSQFIQNHTGKSSTDSSAVNQAKVDELFTLGAPVKRIAEGLLESSSNINFIQLEFNRLSTYSGKISSFQEAVENEIGSLTTSISRGQVLAEKWKNSLDYYKRIGLSENISSVKTIVDQLKEIELKLKEHLNQRLAIQELLLVEDQAVQNYIQELSELQANFLAHLLTATHKPIWALSQDSADSVAQEKLSRSDIDMLIGLENWKEQTQKFFQDNVKKTIWHVVLSLFFLYMVFRFKKSVQEKQQFDVQLERSLPLFTYPWLIWFFVSIVLIYLVYPVVPFSLQPFLITLASIPVFIIGFKIILSEFKISLLIIIALYITDQIFQVLGSAYEVDRWVMLFESAGGLIATILFYNSRKKAINHTITFWKTLGLLSPFLVILMLLSTLLQLFGYVGFSQIITSVVVYSFVTGLITVILYRIGYALIHFLLTDSYLGNLNAVKNERITLQKRLSQVLIFFLTIGWFRSILRKAMLAQPLKQLWDDFYGAEYVYGELTVSLEKFTEFLFVLFGAILISNVIRTLLEEDLLLSLSLKRGVPKAIAMMSKYSIVVIGFFLAVSSLGVGLDKLGFLAGGLGVGIGFGLQNIVANFISGLILIFERPIHEGDVVTAGETNGEVKDIGLRSCVVRSWDGAEVIIPNQEFISCRVTNWTLSDNNRRRELLINTKLEAEPDKVMERITQLLKNKEGILKDPAPMVAYKGALEHAHQFRVLFWLNSNLIRTTSEVQVEVYQILEEMGIANPIPRREIEELKTPEK